jgi:hypothetical protein
MIRLTLTPDPAIRRRPDGSIDTAHYIAEARKLRATQAHRLLLVDGPAPVQPFSLSTLPAR